MKTETEWCEECQSYPTRTENGKCLHCEEDVCEKIGSMEELNEYVRQVQKEIDDTQEILI